MIIAFCLYKYFPFGGLQRDFMRIARTVAARGYQVRIYTQMWEGECPSEFELVRVPVTARTNHGRNSQYYAWVQAHLRQHPAVRVVGFNKMPGLDIYYAADVCYAEKVAQEKGFLYRLTSRYRHYAAFEQAVFRRGTKTELLMLTDRQIADFEKHYQTELARFHILPPGIYPDRKYDRQIADSRHVYREKNQIPADAFFILQVGSDFSRKGVDRTIEAVAALPVALRQRAILLVVGQDKPARFAALASKRGVAEQVKFFSGRDDVAELMAAADVLVHPAYQEAAGIVLLEAITAGLPVIVTEVCGYGFHVEHARAGVVVPEPFSQQALNDALAACTTEQLRIWAENARHYADSEDLYSLPEKAADIILGGIHG